MALAFNQISLFTQRGSRASSLHELQLFIHKTDTASEEFHLALKIVFNFHLATILHQRISSRQKTPFRIDKRKGVLKNLKNSLEILRAFYATFKILPVAINIILNLFQKMLIAWLKEVLKATLWL